MIITDEEEDGLVHGGTAYQLHWGVNCTEHGNLKLEELLIFAIQGDSDEEMEA